MENRIFLPVVMLFLSACAGEAVTGSNAENRRPLDFNSLMRLTPGVSDRAAAQAALGVPSRKIESPTLPDREIWLYDDGIDPTVPRLRLVFGVHNGVLAGVTLSLRSNDPERDLVISQAHFKEATLDVRNLPWPTPHSGPSEKMLVDDTKGIQFLINRTNQRVVSITRFDPKEREPAATSDFKTKK